MNKRKYTMGFLEFLKILKKNIIWIIMLGGLTAIIGFSISNWIIDPVYRADAKMIVISNNEEEILLTNDQIMSAENLVDTYAVVIKSRRVLNEVIENTSLNYSYEQLKKKVNVSAINSTQVMEIVVEADSPEKAEIIVSEILEVSPKVLVDAVAVGTVQTIDTAQANLEPVTPNTLLNTILAGFLGICFAIVVTIFKYFLNDTFISEKELREELGLPVLGVIPSIETRRR